MKIVKRTLKLSAILQSMPCGAVMDWRIDSGKVTIFCREGEDDPPTPCSWLLVRVGAEIPEQCLEWGMVPGIWPYAGKEYSLWTNCLGPDRK